jgi:hypothetical protein
VVRTQSPEHLDLIAIIADHTKVYKEGERRPA